MGRSPVCIELNIKDNDAEYMSPLWILQGVLEMEPFNWERPGGNQMSEAEATPLLAAHLQTCLEKHGVKFNQKGGFRIFDVHNDSGLLQVVAPRLKFKGGTDIIIAPFNASAFDIVPHTRAFVEMKRWRGQRPAVSKENMNQTQAELLGLQLSCKHPVLGLLSDGVADNCFARVVDRAISTSQKLTWSLAVAYLARFLKSSSSDAIESAELGSHMRKRKQRDEPTPCDDACEEQLRRMHALAASKRSPALIEEQLASLDALEESAEGRQQASLASPPSLLFFNADISSALLAIRENPEHLAAIFSSIYRDGNSKTPSHAAGAGPAGSLRGGPVPGGESGRDGGASGIQGQASPAPLHDYVFVDIHTALLSIST